jgi:hypothetical protein
MNQNLPTDLSHDLATRIYVDLIARHAQIADGALTMSTSAASLADMSLRLAEAFMQVEAKDVASKGPVKNYKLDAGDIASWSKA